MPDITTVAIIVDHHAGALIAELADRVHIWAIETPDNRGGIEAIWARRTKTPDELGVTVFHFDPSPPDQVVSHYLSTIDMHHDSYSQSPEWCRAEVYGARLTPEFLADFQSHGFDEFEDTPTGFVATRSRPSPEPN